jgi:hypothetical protein
VSTKRTTTAILAACLALLGAGCGSDEQGEPIPADIRQELESRLAETERRLDAGGGACGDIVNDTEPEVSRILARLPGDVDQDARRTVEDGFARLFELTSEQCDEQKGQETETETTPPPAPLPETETETTPTEPEPPPQEDDKGGGGGDKGGGGGDKGGGGGNKGGIEIPGTGGGGTVAPEEG